MRWGKNRFTVFHMENNTIINKNNTTINSVLHSHNFKPTFAHSLYGLQKKGGEGWSGFS